MTDAPESVRRHENGEAEAGQVVDVDWTEPGPEGLPWRAVRVVPREDLQATVGG